MTADTITVERLASLTAMLDAASVTIFRLSWQVECTEFDPAEAAAIVNETIQNLTNEAR